MYELKRKDHINLIISYHYDNWKLFRIINYEHAISNNYLVKLII